MRRDWDLVRQILITIRDLPAGGDLDEDSFTSRDPAEVHYHLRIMADAGLIDGNDTSAGGDAGYVAEGLTWAGADLLDKIENERVWNAVKAGAKDKGVGLSLDIVKALARIAIKKYTGIDTE